MNSDDTRLINEELNEETPNKKQNNTARMAGTVAGAAAVGVAAGAGAHAAYAAGSDISAEDDLDLEAVDLAEGAAAGASSHTGAQQPQPARPQHQAQAAHPQGTTVEPSVDQPGAQPGTPATSGEGNPGNPTGGTATPGTPGTPGTPQPQPTEPVTPDHIDGEDIDEILAVEEIDENDINDDEVFNFDEIGTVYTVDGEEFTAASFHLDNGVEGVMVDVDGDGVFDEIAAQTSEGLVNVGEAPALTIDDVEHAINPDETYLAQDDTIDHTLADDSYMDDVLDSTLV